MISASLMRRHLDLLPDKAGAVNPQVSPFFEEVISRLLAKQPEDRFADADELRQVLEEGEAGSWWEQTEGRLRAADPVGSLRRMRV